MRASLSHDPLSSVAPLLAEPHLAALDRRLSTVVQTVSGCLKQQRDKGGDEVFYEDLDHLKDFSFPAD